MPKKTGNRSSVSGNTTGPKGTASQRASKQGQIRGREQSASAMVRKSGKKLPNSQGT